MKKVSFPKHVKNGLGIVLCVVALPMVTMLAGFAGDRYHQSTGEAIDDKGTSMRVKSALSNDAEYKYAGVEVQTFKGTVQLSGFVNTSAQKSRAVDLAKSVEGVKEVDNKISVKE
jgi:osmotically-inducible protein OsmY